MDEVSSALVPLSRSNPVARMRIKTGLGDRFLFSLARATGFEPAIFSVTGRRVNQATPRPQFPPQCRAILSACKLAPCRARKPGRNADAGDIMKQVLRRKPAVAALRVSGEGEKAPADVLQGRALLEHLVLARKRNELHVLAGIDKHL